MSPFLIARIGVTQSGMEGALITDPTCCMLKGQPTPANPQEQSKRIDRNRHRVVPPDHTPHCRRVHGPRASDGVWRLPLQHARFRIGALRQCVSPGSHAHDGSGQILAGIVDLAAECWPSGTKGLGAYFISPTLHPVHTTSVNALLVWGAQSVSTAARVTSIRGVGVEMDTAAVPSPGRS